MGLSKSSILDTVELIYYFVLFPITLYLARRHGRHGILGYFYLNSFCVVRIVANILTLVNRNQVRPSIATTVVSSLGLSPIILALAGFLHEANTHLLPAIIARPSAAKKAKHWMYFAQVQIHGVAGLGMVLVIVGTVNLIKAKPGTNTTSDEKLRMIGAMLLLFLWASLLKYAAWLFFKARQVRVQIRRELMELIKWILVAVPFVGLKVVYAVLYTFDHKDGALNPVTGAFAVKLLLVVGVPAVAALVMTWAGLRSSDIGKHQPDFEPVASDSDTGYEARAFMTDKTGYVSA